MWFFFSLSGHFWTKYKKKERKKVCEASRPSRLTDRPEIIPAITAGSANYTEESRVFLCLVTLILSLQEKLGQGCRMGKSTSELNSTSHLTTPQISPLFKESRAACCSSRFQLNFKDFTLSFQIFQKSSAICWFDKSPSVQRRCSSSLQPLQQFV